jgi:hypothetical protein
VLLGRDGAYAALAALSYRTLNVRNRGYVVGMSDFTIKALTPGTFDDFAALVERNKGMFASCWCTWFHPDCAEKGQSAEGNRALKQRLVADGIAHAALVYGGGLVEGYPHDTGGVRKKNSSFLYNGTRTMYEREGFTYDRPKGQGNCVMVREVAPSTRD